MCQWRVSQSQISIFPLITGATNSDSAQAAFLSAVVLHTSIIISPPSGWQAAGAYPSMQWAAIQEPAKQSCCAAAKYPTVHCVQQK